MGTEAAAPRRVLVVDDNESAAEAFGLILDLWGYSVRVCHDGRAGLAAADDFAPDVVLLDIGLPDLDGHAVARELLRHRRRLGHRPPVLIAVTGHGRDEDRRLSLAAGFDRHLVKPIDLDALRSFLASDPARGGLVSHLPL